ncbi:glycoside hydrolase family 3 C-terminal domain-containing protein [Arthrobacter sp. zg-Y859]|uniref:Glycoside hydrolase family 3 C-terminal domain-containing protein n=1 Tax=Arthrobacter jinronghuae TaxID=2964609 RepID=A0ABT1NQT9_9MICC|nr:glycoside hydrolase family 3 C-terminal domain-containing protein [Arthrobacter jinronghuae]MCQ1950103.1 glycoside hydrolase family 3 C-terminal domain-containing protein [Arthrobacter jinronghuae]UWX77093.1 glycoside hydrolase family 3 C-terminal domain-containing protein [Arthrobacter jinronghuae]
MPMSSPDQPSAASLRERVSSLPPDERPVLLSGASFWSTAAAPAAGLRPLVLSDGPHGIRRPRSDTEPGIGDALPATCFPAECLTACSWDTDLLARLGTATAREAAAAYVDVVLGPGLNIKRTPLCGRNFEYFSEDPLLAGALGAAWIRALQAEGVAACPKHFAANNQEADRMRINAAVDERTLYEIYLRAFETVVRTAHPWTLMAAYNKVNGIHAAENAWLLETVLRGEWGFDGLVMSDWGAVTDRAAALDAGLDLEMPASGGLGLAELQAGLVAGTVNQQMVDSSVARLLQLADRTAAPAHNDADLDGHHQLAREAAAASMVLLKNEGGILPFSPDLRLAVVGELARTPRYQGAGSSQVTPTRVSVPLEVLSERTAAAVFAAGYRLDGTPDPELVTEAETAAAAADAVLFFLGLPEDKESEGFDRPDLALPENQLALLRAVTAANPWTVVVLFNGGAVETGWVEQVPAVLEAWLPGQAGGEALADVLLGDVNPSGKLAETFPRRIEDTPAFGNYPGEAGTVRYGEGVLVGYRWYDARAIEPAFAFGHGLSYTAFDYTGLALRLADTDMGPVLAVEATLTNTGSRAGAEVLQVYSGAPAGPAVRPPRELRAFRKLFLEPGASAPVALTVPLPDLARFDPASHRWITDAGTYRIDVGSSSRDIRLSGTIDLPGTDGTAAPLTLDSTISEWLAHPLGRTLLGGADRSSTDAAGGTGTGGMADALALMGSMPLRRLARFPGTPLTPDLLAGLEQALRGAGPAGGESS